MTLKDLKIAIMQKTLSDKFLILKNVENPAKDSNASFLSEQYLQEISKARNLEISKINSIYDPLQSTLSILVINDLSDTASLLSAINAAPIATKYLEFSGKITSSSFKLIPFTPLALTPAIGISLIS